MFSFLDLDDIDITPTPERPAPRIQYVSVNKITKQIIVTNESNKTTTTIGWEYNNSNTLITTTDNIIKLNLNDENVVISLTRTATIFSMYIFVNDIYVNIYKKIPHNRNNLIKSITNNFIKHKSKAIDDICKISEYIYENPKFVFTLLKLKLLFNSHKEFTPILYENKMINICTSELNTLRKIQLLSEHSNSDFYNIIKYSKSQLSSLKSLNNRGKWVATSLHNYSKLTRFLSINNDKLINKENFELISEFEINLPHIVKGTTKHTYITNNTLYVADIAYNKIINFNEKLNYYYFSKNIHKFNSINIFKSHNIVNGTPFISRIFNPRNISTSPHFNQVPNVYIQTQTINDGYPYFYINTNIDFLSSDLNEIIKNDINRILLVMNKFKQLSSTIDKNLLYRIYNTLTKKQTIIQTAQFINCKNSGIRKLETAIENLEYNWKIKDVIFDFVNTKLINKAGNRVLSKFIDELLKINLLPHKITIKQFKLSLPAIDIVGLNCDKLTYDNIYTCYNTKENRSYNIELSIGILINRKFTKEVLEAFENKSIIWSLAEL